MASDVQDKLLYMRLLLKNNEAQTRQNNFVYHI